MLKASLTLWYAVAVLLGPGVCCCSWVTPKAHAVPAPKAPAPKRAKACCSAPATDAPETQPAGKHPAHDPSKCPCKPNKKVVESTQAAAAPDVSASLRLAEWVAVAVVPGLAPSSLDSPRPSPPVGPPPLGGRALLSAFHILRC